MVKLTNPSYPYPIPVEMCPLPYDKAEPEYIGNDGESYYSQDGKTWTDIVELGYNGSQFHLYITNVCVKAFTNPLPESGEAVSNVRFSLMERPVASGEHLELIGEGQIYYQVTAADGTVGEVVAYETPIVLEGACTVTAWNQKNGKQGNLITRSYSQAESKLLDLDVNIAGEKQELDLSQENTQYKISVDTKVEDISIRPRGADTITVNGMPVESDSWSDPYPVGGWGNYIHSSNHTGSRKDPHHLYATGYRSALTIDYLNETVSYDDTRYLLADIEGNPVANGTSITPYIVEEGEENVILTLSAKDGSNQKQEVIPKRPAAVPSDIDFAMERTVSIYGDWNEVADNPDMIGAQKWQGDHIPVIPGKNIYIRKYATETSFESKVVCIPVPASRPEMPEAKVQSTTPDTIIMEPVEGAQYRIAPDGAWQEENILTDLEMDATYTVQVRIGSTETSFASQADEASATTGEGLIISILYQYQGKEIFKDEFLAIPGEQTITADQEELAQFGMVLEDPEQDKVQVTVTQKDGQWMADISPVVFHILPNIDPQSFNFEVSYWDQDGNRIEGGGKQAFNTIGPVSRESIPLPYGYQQVIPAHPDENWLYPTGLYYGEGGWYIYPEKVMITVEKKAQVTVTFQQEDGTILTKEELYFGEEGAGLQQVTAPEGYAIVGGE